MFRSFNFYAGGRSALLLLARSKKSKAARGGKQDRPKKAKANALPPKAEEKIKQWVEIMELERNAAGAMNKSMKLTSLPFRSYSHDVFNGVVLELGLPVNFTDEDFTTWKDRLKGGQWVTVREGPDRSAAAVFLSMSVDSVKLKLLGKCEFGEWDRDNSFTMDFGVAEQSPLNYLLDFWRDKNAWARKPGWKNFLAGHHAQPLALPKGSRKLAFISEGLNKSQTAAVTRAVSNQGGLLSIQGPPGTGKSAVVAEIVLQASRAKKSVLVLAPSRNAVSNVARKVNALLTSPDPSHCHVSYTEGPLTLRDRMQAHQHFDQLTGDFDFINSRLEDRDYNSSNVPSGRAYMLRGQIREEILFDTQVIYATVGSAMARNLAQHGFQPDLVVLDEAAQCWECVAWHAAMQASKVVFVGDQHQLSSYVHTDEARHCNFNRSVMEYLEREFKDRVQCRLQRQYRSNAAIMRWSNETFYEGEVEADDSVKNINLQQILRPDGNFDDICTEPLVFVDTHSAGNSARERHRNRSICNDTELAVVEGHVQGLLAAGLSPQQIGVISPYNEQVQNLRKALPADVPVNTVDGFQGGEHDVICMSLVRNNPKHEIGFLRDLRRMNVALTRAKRQFFLVGDSASLEQEPALRRLLDILHKEARVIRLDRGKRNVMTRTSRK